MAQSVPATRPQPTHDWTVDAVDRIEAVVEVVRDKTTVPVTKVARAIVYGLIVAVMAVLAGTLVVVGLFRLHVYLPFDKEGQRVYASYFGVGAIFVLLGLLLWRKRAPRTKE